MLHQRVCSLKFPVLQEYARYLVRYANVIQVKNINNKKIIMTIIIIMASEIRTSTNTEIPFDAQFTKDT